MFEDVILQTVTGWFVYFFPIVMACRCDFSGCDHFFLKRSLIFQLRAPAHRKTHMLASVKHLNTAQGWWTGSQRGCRLIILNV